MSISLEDVKKLKDLTGVGLTDAKKALTETDGDFDKALEAMRKKGLTRAEKKGEREALEGLVDSYVHSDRIGVLVEVNCETDFVARTDDFKNLVHDIALHVSASAPEYITLDDISEEEKERVKVEFSEKAKNEGKPADMIEKIITGQISKYFAEKTLLEQPFIKNPDQTVGDLVKEHIAKLGENIVVRQIRRIELGVSE
ncbi:translation elongation factor Ts [Candidatus Saccharibacteria bacterium RIFCSPHIGHO2_12_FULL_42_8]|nr:MAG: translation elongation factor Ts [Candidatus Saccharibacteria bacterium RIFCSPHIGHO2_12_FULL_42_8]